MLLVDVRDEVVRVRVGRRHCCRGCGSGQNRATARAGVVHMVALMMMAVVVMVVVKGVCMMMVMIMMLLHRVVAVVNQRSATSHQIVAVVVVASVVVKGRHWGTTAGLRCDHWSTSNRRRGAAT